MLRRLSPSVSAPGSSLSAVGGRSVFTALNVAPAEVAAAAEIIERMKGSFGVRPHCQLRTMDPDSNSASVLSVISPRAFADVLVMQKMVDSFRQQTVKMI